MKVGIIGLPGSGKTTLFQLLTEHFEGPDYRLGTKPQLRQVRVHDPRLERLRDDYAPQKYTPATVDILDFPGVDQEGRDRSGIAEYLAPAREAQALIVVLRGFRNSSIARGETVDPASELDEVLGELVLSDLEIAERRLEKLDARSKKPNFSSDDKRELEIVRGLVGELEQEKSLRELDLSADEKKRVSGYGFLSLKPVVVVVSAAEASDDHSAILPTLRAKSASEEVHVLAVRNEVDILQLQDEERAMFMEEYGITELHRDAVIAAAYRAVGAISFLTAGDKEVRAWTIRSGETAPEAAGAIHSDIQRGFIRAEVVSFDDYVAHKGIKGAKEAGVFRLEGKEYVIRDGDIIEFRFSV